MVPLSEVAVQLEQRGDLTRRHEDHSERIVEHVQALLGRPLPPDLVDFYRERIDQLGQFTAQSPRWNERVGWRSPDKLVTRLLAAEAVPLFDDGCGSFYGLDLTPGVKAPAVYFFDHEDDFQAPRWAAGSSLSAFMLILADKDRAFAEGWPPKWELRIDPEIESCPRAPAVWDAG